MEIQEREDPLGNMWEGNATRAESPTEYAKFAQHAQEIAKQAIIALRKGNKALGALMNENHRLLETIGVSSPDLDNLIAAARVPKH